jgi:hypothetical protein
LFSVTVLRRAAASQDADIQVGTPSRGKSQRTATK